MANMIDDNTTSYNSPQEESLRKVVIDSCTVLQGSVVEDLEESDTSDGGESDRETYPIDHQSMNDEKVTRAMSLNTSADLLCDHEEYDEAMKLYQKALNLQKKALGSMHVCVANTYSRIAWIYERMEAFDDALNYYETALEIKTMELGTDHSDLQELHESMARVLDFQDEQELAAEFRGKMQESTQAPPTSESLDKLIPSLPMENTIVQLKATPKVFKWWDIFFQDDVESFEQATFPFPLWWLLCTSTILIVALSFAV